VRVFNFHKIILSNTNEEIIIEDYLKQINGIDLNKIYLNKKYIVFNSK